MVSLVSLGDSETSSLIPPLKTKLSFLLDSQPSSKAKIGGTDSLISLKLKTVPVSLLCAKSLFTTLKKVLEPKLTK